MNIYKTIHEVFSQTSETSQMFLSFAAKTDATHHELCNSSWQCIRNMSITAYI